MCEIAEAYPDLILADAGEPVIISHNRVRCDRGWDIDLDDGSSNYIIKDNLCLNGGIKLREGFFRRVENNIMINNTFHPHVWFSHSGDVFRGNIVMRPYRPISLQGWGAEVDYNLFTDSAALAEAHQNGTDAHSAVVEIAFADFTQGDFTPYLLNGADTLNYFRNFDMDNFGVVSPNLKALALRPQMPLPIAGSEAAQQNVQIWNGWAVKNLDSLGERSATGMDSEHGIYVISLISFDSPMRDFLRSNDVILAVNDIPVDNLDQLQNLGEQLVSVTIFRNQKRIKINLQ